MHGGPAWATDDWVAEQHEQQHGNAGRRVCPDAEMRPADVQSSAGERGRTHCRWEALDIQPKGLRERHTHAESSQAPREILGPRRPGEKQTEEGRRSAGVGDRV
jgi:hypothetical protein